MNRELTKNELAKITESVVFNFLAQHANEQIKHTSAYKHQLKRDINKVNKTLEKAESEEFDKIFDATEDTAEFVDSLSGSIIEMVKNMLNNQESVSLFIKSNIFNAWVKDPKRLEGIASKILNV